MAKTRKRQTNVKADNPGRSIPINFDLSVGRDLWGFLHWMAGEVMKFHKVKYSDVRRSSLEKIEDACSFLVANLLHASEISRECFVGVYLRPEAYVRHPRYRTRPISFDNLCLVIDWLTKSDPPYAELVAGFFDRRSRTPIGKRSKVRASDRLLIVIDRYLALWAETQVTGVLNTNLLSEPVEEYEEAPAALPRPLIVASPSSDVIRLRNDAGEYIDYENDDSTTGMRQRLNT